MYKIYFDDLSPSIRFLISQDFYYLINEKSKTLGSEQPHTSPPTLASSVQDCIACADLRRRSRFQLAESGSRERVTIAVSMRPKHRSAMKHVATERVARGIYRSANAHAFRYGHHPGYRSRGGERPRREFRTRRETSALVKTPASGDVGNARWCNGRLE